MGYATKKDILKEVSFHLIIFMFYAMFFLLLICILLFLLTIVSDSHRCKST